MRDEMPWILSTASSLGQSIRVVVLDFLDVFFFEEEREEEGLPLDSSRSVSAHPSSVSRMSNTILIALECSSSHSTMESLLWQRTSCAERSEVHF